MSQTAIEFQNVTKQFDNAALPSVDQVSLTIEGRAALSNCFVTF